MYTCISVLFDKQYYYETCRARTWFGTCNRWYSCWPFSIDGQIKAKHYNSSTMHHNVFVAEASDNDSDLPLSLMSELIEFFSFSGQTVLDIMSGFGE